MCVGVAAAELLTCYDLLAIRPLPLLQFQVWHTAITVAAAAAGTVHWLRVNSTMNM
jgi:hypothetical protein